MKRRSACRRLAGRAARVVLALCVGTLAAPAAWPQAMGARGDDFLYRIQPGDTLEQLARRYTMDAAQWSTLQSLNRIEDPYRLRIGSVLRIPFPLIPERPAVARVVHVLGGATADGARVVPGQALHDGHVVRTAGDGMITLELEDGSLLSLPPDSHLRISRLRVFQGTPLADTVLEVESGSLESIVAPDGDGVGRFEVRTPVTITGVRGTRLRVHNDAAGSRHEVLDGATAVAATTSAGQEHRVGANQGAAYDARGAFHGVHRLLPAPTLPDDADAVSRTRTLAFPAVDGAHGYRVRITRDAQGALLAYDRRVREPALRLPGLAGGEYHLFIRAIDGRGIEGQDGRLRVRLYGGLLSSSGQPVLSADGTPVRLHFD